MRVIEIRSYRLQAGGRARFHQLVSEQSLALQLAWGIDVVAFGPSLHDECGYYLIRAFADLADLQARQASFYASSGWRTGPREAIVELIVADSDVVLAVSAEAVESLRGDAV